MRIAIHFQGKLNGENSYVHPTRHEREHISLLHIDTPQEIKDQNNFAHLEALEWKHQNVAYIDNPQAIAERATELLEGALSPVKSLVRLRASQKPALTG